MPGKISVDSTTGKVTLEFDDDKGDTDAAEPAGDEVTFTSENLAVFTVAADPTNGLVGDITPVAEGAANVVVNVRDSTGNATAFPPISALVTIVAGAAVGDALVISST